jgi:hypothetical protein
MVRFGALLIVTRRSSIPKGGLWVEPIRWHSCPSRPAGNPVRYRNSIPFVAPHAPRASPTRSLPVTRSSPRRRTRHGGSRATARASHPIVVAGCRGRRPTPSLSRRVLTVDYRIKVHMDLQADKSPVVVKGPFFPRVVNPRYRICGTMCNTRIQSSKARKGIF